MRRMTRYFVPALALCAALSLVAATPASAQDDYWFVEGFGGLTFIGGDIEIPCRAPVTIPECGGDVNIPDIKGDFDDDTPTFGFGFGKRFNEKSGFKASLSFIDGDDTFGAPFEGSPLEIAFFFVDFSYMYHPWGKNFYVFGGPGFVDVDLDLKGSNFNFEADDQNFTMHLGWGKMWNLGADDWFVRWQGKFRVIDSDVYDDVDAETTLGFGYKF